MTQDPTANQIIREIHVRLIVLFLNESFGLDLYVHEIQGQLFESNEWTALSEDRYCSVRH
jgi:hypothetical protein